MPSMARGRRRWVRIPVVKCATSSALLSLPSAKERLCSVMNTGFVTFERMNCSSRSTWWWGCSHVRPESMATLRNAIAWVHVSFSVLGAGKSGPVVTTREG
jgi:hypothetical protein